MDDSMKGKHGKYTQLEGKQFGKWTVLRRAESNHLGRNTDKWVCQCACGAVREVIARALVRGRSKSCGLCTKLDLTGRRFGRLTVLREAENQKSAKIRRWVCLCDCGAITTPAAYNLTYGNTKSCGHCRRKKLEQSLQTKKAVRISAVRYGVVCQFNSLSEAAMFAGLTPEQVETACQTGTTLGGYMWSAASGGE